MNYYKNQSGEVFAFNDIQKVPDGLIAMTPEEVQEHLNPAPTTEQLATQARADRDAKLTATNWLVERHREEQETGVTTLTAQQYADLLAYRQALRDVPQQDGFPETIDWPVAPPFLAV